MTAPRWDTPIYHRDKHAKDFIAEYFGGADRHPMLICGAGFDPRAREAAKLLEAAAGSRLQAHFIREDRPRPDPTMLAAADANEAELKALIPRNTVHHVAVFSDDEKTVVAGREMVRMFNSCTLDGVTDLVVDLSALSTGASFPLVKYLFDKAQANPAFPNVHVLVASSPATDDAVATELMDHPILVPGFGEQFALYEGASKPKLWLPQLGKRAAGALDMIVRRMRAETSYEICPILPFPAGSPRAVEELVEAFQQEIDEAWLVDDRDFLYAAEDDPLDLYRTILRIDTLRGATYAIEGGSITVLSPLGTKVMALGALLAALERDLPIMYVETLRYKMVKAPQGDSYGLVHLWLTGEAYPKP